jgi:hypothetical protein
VCILQPDSLGCPGFGFYLLPPSVRADPAGSAAVLVQNCSVRQTVQPALVFGGVSTPGPSVAIHGGWFEAPLRSSPAVSPVQIVGGAVWSGTVGGIAFEDEPVIRYGQGAAAAPWLKGAQRPCRCERHWSSSRGGGRAATEGSVRTQAATGRDERPRAGGLREAVMLPSVGI